MGVQIVLSAQLAESGFDEKALEGDNCCTHLVGEAVLTHLRVTVATRATRTSGETGVHTPSLLPSSPRFTNPMATKEGGGDAACDACMPCQVGR